MPAWLDEFHEVEWSYDTPDMEFTVSENPVVSELLGPDGEVIRQWRERPPFGFR